MDQNLRPCTYNASSGPLIDSSKQIRLATLHPGSNDEPIFCTLETHDLDDAPSYMGVSYCWGDQNDNAVIKLQGNDWQVPTNLYTALKRIRREDEPRLLWIDAICINQADTTEKNHQIPLMGKIYESASLVIAWLGDCDEDLSGAFEVISKFSNMVAFKMAQASSLPISLESMKLLPKEESRHDLQALIKNKRIWSLIFDIFQRPYWSRLWIVQELCLAQDVLYTCGNLEISQKDLTFFFNSGSFLVQQGDQELTMLDPDDALSEGLMKTMSLGAAWKLSRMAEKFQHLRNSVRGSGTTSTDLGNIGRQLGGVEEHLRKEMVEDKGSGSKMGVEYEQYSNEDGIAAISTKLASFMYLLRRTNSSTCQDPRDRIYGLLGLTSLHKADSQLLIIPDYRKDVLDVYKDFTYAHILNTNSLDILQLSGLQRRSGVDLQHSWVADLRFNNSWAKKTGFGATNASQQWKANCEISDSGSLLTKALFCGSIDGIQLIQGYFQRLSVFESMFENLTSEMLDILDSLISFISRNSVIMEPIAGYQNEFKSKATITKILFQLLLLTSHLDRGPEHCIGLCLMLGLLAMRKIGIADLDGYDEESYMDCYLLWAEGIENIRMLSYGDKRKSLEQAFPSSFAFDEWPEIGQYDPKKCIKAFLDGNKMSKRRWHAFFVTERGVFGFSGDKIELRDEVCILPGGSLPFILRRAGNVHQLVDFSFVHGMMDGEMVELHKKGILALENIEIV